MGQPSCPLHTRRGLFKTDRVLGTAQLKLDALETACEVREILEVRCGHLSEGSSVALSFVNMTQMLPTGPGPPKSLLC